METNTELFDRTQLEEMYSLYSKHTSLYNYCLCEFESKLKNIVKEIIMLEECESDSYLRAPYITSHLYYFNTFWDILMEPLTCLKTYNKAYLSINSQILLDEYSKRINILQSAIEQNCRDYIHECTYIMQETLKTYSFEGLNLTNIEIEFKEDMIAKLKLKLIYSGVCFFNYLDEIERIYYKKDFIGKSSVDMRDAGNKYYNDLAKCIYTHLHKNIDYKKKCDILEKYSVKNLIEELICLIPYMIDQSCYDYHIAGGVRREPMIKDNKFFEVNRFTYNSLYY